MMINAILKLYFSIDDPMWRVSRNIVGAFPNICVASHSSYGLRHFFLQALLAILSFL